MGRIRTIKPEFPQSESMGRVSRDARLLFVMLWTICDDSGRARGNSRILASLLFPYDDDAFDLMDGWLAELEAEGCVVRYVSGGSTFLQICNWLNHQKIDKPSKSKIPEFDESSRILANPREHSSEDQGPKEGNGMDLGAIAPRAREPFDDTEFVAFYAAYPRHEAKQDALKAWKAVKPDLQTLLDDIRKRLNTGHWSDPKFIPLPATYLRGSRWTDAITPRNGNGTHQPSARPDNSAAGRVRANVAAELARLAAARSGGQDLAVDGEYVRAQVDQQLR